MNACPNCGRHLSADDATPTFRSISSSSPYGTGNAPVFVPSAERSGTTPYETTNPYQGSNPYEFNAYPYQPSVPPSVSQPILAPTPRKRPGLLILAGSLIALILILGAGLIYYTAVYYPTTENAQATATAHDKQQARQQGQTQTAVAQLRATTQAQQERYTQATGTTPVIDDPLNNADTSTWPPFTAKSPDKGGCAFKNGSYHVSEAAHERFIYCPPSGTYSNFAFQVEMTILSGDNGGILFRSTAASNHYYLLDINKAGFYTFNVFTAEGEAQLLRQGTAASFKTGYNQMNQVTLIAQDDQISLYINKQFATTFSDTRYKSGALALVADTSEAATEVAYANAKIWTLS